jgi:hypothetical protein
LEGGVWQAFGGLSEALISREPEGFYSFDGKAIVQFLSKLPKELGGH